MVLIKQSTCPVKVHSELTLKHGLSEISLGSRPLLVTSEGWLKRGIYNTVAQQIGAQLVVAPPISPNPRVTDLIEFEKIIPVFDSVIAIGGGSVLDASKAIIALRAISGDEQIFRAALNKKDVLSGYRLKMPFLAVPTTSGTGSEVTCWATLWGDSMEKYSLHHQDLFPNAAILDPSLCLSLPKNVTLYSGLDAVSHAMEAIWNRKSTVTSDQAAIIALTILRHSLPEILLRPDDRVVRKELQMASLYAGFAMSQTQTALAHSISYALTANLGMPHGFACSITLGEVFRFNADHYASQVQKISDCFNCSVSEFPDTFVGWLRALGVPNYIDMYCGIYDENQINSMQLINPARAGNNLRFATNEEARKILLTSLKQQRL